MGAQHFDFRQVHALRGDQFHRVVEPQVRRRETQFPAQLLAAHHNAPQPVRVAQHRFRILHSPLLQGPAYLGGTHHDIAGRGSRNDLNGQAERLRQRADRVGAEAVGAEAVVVAEDEAGGAETVAQDVADVILRGQAREGAVEGQRLHAVDAERTQQRLLLLRRIQQAQDAGILLQDGARVLREGNDNRLLPPLPGRGDERLYHLAVSQMDTVKEAGGDYSHLTSGKS